MKRLISYLATAAGLAVAWPVFAAGQRTDDARVSLIEAGSLAGWVVERRPAEGAFVSGGVLTISDRTGWVRADRLFSGFDLHVEGRVAPGARASLVIAGHGTVIDATGYALPFATAESTALSTRLTRAAVNPGGFLHALRDRGEWQAYDIRCRHDLVEVAVNGSVVASDPVERNCDGWIGFAVEGGSLDLRNASIRPETVNSQATWMVTPVYIPGNSVTAPRPRRQSRPNYTPDALRAKIAGGVLLECVVAADGHVADVRVERSLDAAYGLDDAAIKSAKEWEFEPATRFGQAVPVLVTIEMTFTMKD